MPSPKAYANAFSAHEVQAITRLSLPMIDYLARIGFLRPAYDLTSRTRGRVRYYSYRDLVVARTVQRLREAGLQLGRLKAAINYLSREEIWPPLTNGSANANLKWLVTDGKEVLIRNEDGFLDELKPAGQRSFAFVISLQNIQHEVFTLIPDEKRVHFSMKNEPFLEAPVSRIDPANRSPTARGSSR